MIGRLIILGFFLTIFGSANSQRNCGSAVYKKTFEAQYPLLKTLNKNFNFGSVLAETSSVEVPVVVHIVYKTQEENIPDSEIQKQIASLNLDFAAKNRDYKDVPGGFKKIRSGNTNISFWLKGVHRVKTDVDSFLCDIYDTTRPDGPEKEPIKFASLGGADAIDLNQSLNIWVGNIYNPEDEQLLGYSTLPYAPLIYDGVVVYYKSFGFQNCLPRFALGRTLTHEIGHYFALAHIWGDERCGDDGISDTPIQDTSNAAVPRFPKFSIYCDNRPLGDMFMNFMDYVDDIAMNMFTIKQRERMMATFEEGGPRQYYRSNLRNNSLVPDRDSLFLKINQFIAGSTDTALGILPSTVQLQKKAAQQTIVRVYDLSNKVIASTTTSKNLLSISGLKNGNLYLVKVFEKGRLKEELIESFTVLGTEKNINRAIEVK